MAIRSLFNNSGLNTNTNLNSKTYNVAALRTPVTAETWVRNPSWPQISANSTGDDKLVGLYAVFPHQSNFIAFTCSGNYTVDFGDGYVNSFTSGTQVNYSYNYNNLSGTDAPVTLTDSGDLVTRNSHGYTDGMEVQFYNIVNTTGIVEAQIYYVINATTNTFQISNIPGGSALPLTTDGSATLLPYRIAIVVITATSGSTLFSINLQSRHSQAGLSAYSTGWLDISISAASVSILTFGTVSNVVRHGYLEQVSLLNLGVIGSFSYLFSQCTALRSVTITADTSNVANTSNMFTECYSLTQAPMFYTGSVQNMANMFSNCYRLTEVPKYNTEAVQYISDMFVYCYSLTSVPLFDTQNVISMSGMFRGCTNLVKVPAFNTQNVLYMNQMFDSCVSLETSPLFNTQTVVDMSFMFSGCKSLKSVPLFNTASVTNMSTMFNGCSDLETVPLFNTQNVTLMSSMFNGCSSLETIPLFNTGNVTNMGTMFNGCSSLETIPLFNTANVTIMSSMFSGCTALVEVPLLNTVKVTNMSTMFLSCNSLKKVPLFNTSLVTNMSNMFGSCLTLLTVPLFNTANVTNMSSMFNNCWSLIRVPLFDTGKVTNMGSMFSGCYSLAEVPKFNTALVTNMGAMFNGCRSLQMVPELTTTAVTSSSGFSSIFNACPSISRILAKNFRFTFSVGGCKLSPTELDQIYTNLPTVTSQTITVTGNWGTASDTPSIATAKGWTVTG